MEDVLGSTHEVDDVVAVADGGDETPLLEELEAMREADPDGFAELAKAVRCARARLRMTPPSKRHSA